MAKTKSTSTSTARFEVSQDGYGVIEHVRRFSHSRYGTGDGALEVAQNWIERKDFDPKLGTVTIFDRMAHFGKPQLWTVTKCTGAAHSDPFIDHCGVCMPNWGIVVRVLSNRANSRFTEFAEKVDNAKHARAVIALVEKKLGGAS